VLEAFAAQLSKITLLLQQRDNRLFSHSTGSQCYVPVLGVTYFQGDIPLQCTAQFLNRYWFKQLRPAQEGARPLYMDPIDCVWLVESDDAVLQRVRALAGAIASCRTNDAVRFSADPDPSFERSHRLSSLTDLLVHFTQAGGNFSARALGSSRSRIEFVHAQLPVRGTVCMKGLEVLVAQMPHLQVLSLQRLTRDSDLSSLPLPPGCAIELIDASAGHTLTVPPDVDCYCRTGLSFATPTWVRIAGSREAPHAIEQRAAPRDSKAGPPGAAGAASAASVESPAAFEGAVFARWLHSNGGVRSLENAEIARAAAALGPETVGIALAFGAPPPPQPKS
jgi:hypothetical protein